MAKELSKKEKTELMKKILVKQRLKREVINLIKKNIEVVGGGSVLTCGKTLYKFIFDEDGEVSMLPEAFNTPKGCIGVDKWQFGNGFQIDETTSNYRLAKVAQRVIETYESILKLNKE